jgi:hypothetical protein
VTAWSQKGHAPFSEVWAWVRRALWAAKYVPQSPFHEEQVLFSLPEWEILLDQLAATT